MAFGAIGAAIIGGSAAAFSAIAVGMVACAVVGAAVGGIVAAVTGGDILDGMLIGAIGGLAVGAVFGTSIGGAMSSSGWFAGSGVASTGGIGLSGSAAGGVGASATAATGASGITAGVGAGGSVAGTVGFGTAEAAGGAGLLGAGSGVWEATAALAPMASGLMQEDIDTGMSADQLALEREKIQASKDIANIQQEGANSRQLGHAESSTDWYAKNRAGENAAADEARAGYAMNQLKEEYKLTEEGKQAEWDRNINLKNQAGETGADQMYVSNMSDEAYQQMVANEQAARVQRARGIMVGPQGAA